MEQETKIGLSSKWFFVGGFLASSQLGLPKTVGFIGYLPGCIQP